MKIKHWLLFLLAAFFAVPILAQTNLPGTNGVPTVAPSGTVNLNLSTILLAIIPVAVPLIVALGKVLIPRLPSVLLPILAPALGALINWLASLATGSAANPILALALGSAGVGLREVVDQLKQQVPPSAAVISKPPTVPPAAAVLLIFGLLWFAGCAVNQQTTAYNTLFTLEGTTTTGVDYYDSLVIKGAVPTNSVPTVSAAYNSFQGAMMIALKSVQGNSNAVAPPNLALQSATVLNLVTNATGGK